VYWLPPENEPGMDSEGQQEFLVLSVAQAVTLEQYVAEPGVVFRRLEIKDYPLAEATALAEGDRS